MGELTCFKCGQLFRIDEYGIAQHLTVEGEIDYDQDADHVPYGDPVDSSYQG